MNRTHQDRRTTPRSPPEESRERSRGHARDREEAGRAIRPLSDGEILQRYERWDALGFGAEPTEFSSRVLR